MLNKLIVALSLVLFISCASATNAETKDPLAKDTFSFPEPTSNDISQKITLWGTYYYLPQIKDDTGVFPLRDMNSLELGPRLSKKDWCSSAMEGSVQFEDKGGVLKTYNYAGVTATDLVDCSSIFKFDVSRTKFREAHGPYGDGLDDYILSPYRTLATDRNIIAPGSVLYIPQARGAKIVLTNGRVIIHDGYFFAADKGGAIKDNHIDVFIGINETAPFFPWIKSNQNKTFEAYIISDKKINSDLSDLHLGK